MPCYWSHLEKKSLLKTRSKLTKICLWTWKIWYKNTQIIRKDCLNRTRPSSILTWSVNTDLKPLVILKIIWRKILLISWISNSTKKQRTFYLSTIQHLPKHRVVDTQPHHLQILKKKYSYMKPKSSEWTNQTVTKLKGMQSWLILP